MRLASLVLCLMLLFVTGIARAQGTASSAPPSAGSAPRGAGSAPPAAGSAAAPQNPHAQADDPHAGVANPHAQAGDPHAGVQNPHARQVQDSNKPDSELPPGTIDVTIADPEDRGLAGVDVRLGILSQKISEGESRSSQTAKTDAEGRVRFTNLAATNDKSYRVTVQFGEGEYGSTPFNLRDNAGQRVLLHVYPTTSDMSRTVVMGVFMSVEPRDDVFQLDVVAHVFNVSKMGWIPKGTVFDLPEGFKAFSADDSMSDARFEVMEGRGAVLRGTFPPGEERVRFRFQIPNPHNPDVTFAIGLPERVAQGQVVAAASPEMGLEVAEGFPQAEVRRSGPGDRVLYTMRMIKRGEDTIRKMTVTLTGLRVPSSGRVVAVAIALLFACFGGLAARGDIHLASAEKVQSDKVRARDLILRELVLVEHAKTSGELGPNAYERAHRTLLDALARIGVPDEKKLAKKRKVARA